MRKAFTITELLVVVAIIAILASILIPTIKNATNNKRGMAPASAPTSTQSPEYVPQQ